eukprot:TRINITY_DN2401_c0_g1_i2.p1 TRINITY_DN2401_c0_g1~~TRINITY_DN2401_c0_g1_i2.p1  ORF type:complete len:869 (-),score=148.64 TRINITY_DN2401_c0_g1_i2:137-2686(-)
MAEAPQALRLLALLAALLLQTAHGSVLSSSKLESCVNDGSEKFACDMKMVLTLTLEHGQLETESAQFMIREVKDDSGGARELKKPWKVSWQKSKAFWRYPLKYVQDVNNKPFEGIVKVGWLTCNDNPKSNVESITCGVALLGGNRVPASEGFCCGCSPSDIVTGSPTRSQDLKCNMLELSDSAHCLNFDDLWYSVYEVDRPQIFYDIKVTVSIPQDYAASWQNVSYRSTELLLNHQQPIAQAEGGALQLELVGDFATATAPHRFESKYLVVPNRPTSNARVDSKNPLRHAMLVDRSMFDLSGMTCDKIGVSYPAFKYQAQACNKPAGSCLASQLDDLHKEDTARLQAGQGTRYFVSGFSQGVIELGRQQQGTSGTQIYLGCPLNQRQTSLLRVEARADSTMFVINVASGRIAKAEAPSFEALQGGGHVKLMIISTGQVTADFTLGLTNCSQGLDAGPALSVSLRPLETSSHQIKLYASATGSGKFDCMAALFDSQGGLTDSRLVQVNVSALQFTQGAQGGQGGGGGEDATEDWATGGDCASTCPALWDVICFVAHGCWTQLAIALAVPVIILCCCMVCWWSVKRGLPCRILSCICSGSSASPSSSWGGGQGAQAAQWQLQLQQQQQQQQQQMQQQWQFQQQQQQLQQQQMQQQMQKLQYQQQLPVLLQTTQVGQQLQSALSAEHSVKQASEGTVAQEKIAGQDQQASAQQATLRRTRKLQPRQTGSRPRPHRPPSIRTRSLSHDGSTVGPAKKDLPNGDGHSDPVQSRSTPGHNKADVLPDRRGAARPGVLQAPAGCPPVQRKRREYHKCSKLGPAGTRPLPLGHGQGNTHASSGPVVQTRVRKASETE